MLRKPLLTLFGALALAALFCYGVARLFVLRYEKGDVYPPYSTLRADPLGVKGIYEALDRLPEVGASRNFRPLPKLQPAAPVTLVYAGVNHRAYWEDRELRHFNGLVVDGTRAVFTFLPVEKTLASEEDKRADAEAREKKEKARDEKIKRKGKKLGAKERAAEKKKKDDGKKSGDKEEEDEETEANPAISFKEVASNWGFAFDFLPPKKEESKRTAKLADAKAKLEPELSWHTALCFKDLKPEWKVLYECDGKPVVIERRLGRGSLVLAADSYFLSNEAMRKERHPQLLARIFDGPPTLVFDEEHHGVSDDPGIASLARKYRLHGVVAGILLIAILFVWKNAVRFIPAFADDTRDGDIVLGKESSAGFVNLLRRTIKPAELLPLCLAEWRKSAPPRPAEKARVEQLAAQEQARPARQRDPVTAYKTIAQALTRTR